MNINPTEFQKSINKEIVIIKNRVRDLIGGAHWGEEGRYKEAILKNVIKRFLPSNLSVGTGFIVKEDSNNIPKLQTSSQIDIIIYDNTYPVLFNESDFIITTEKNVKGIIEVKTKVRNANGNSDSILEIINKFNELKKFDKLKSCSNNSVFKGIFAFEYDDEIDNDRINDSLIASAGMVNHISLGKDIFIRFWEDGIGLVPPVECNSKFYNIYNIEDLSFSYFISNLINEVCSHSLDDRYWLLFPIINSKERDRIKTICLSH